MEGSKLKDDLGMDLTMVVADIEELRSGQVSGECFGLSSRWLLRKDKFRTTEYSIHNWITGETKKLSPSAFFLLSLCGYRPLAKEQLCAFMQQNDYPPPTCEDLMAFVNAGFLSTVLHARSDSDAYYDLINAQRISSLESWDVPISSTPMTAEIHLTTRCNLRCKYCGYDCTMHDETVLYAGEWSRVFQEMADSRMTALTVSGGEPFLHPDFHNILSSIAGKSLKVTILSNGTLITNDHMLYLKAENVTISISLDGTEPKYHDPLRGHGTHSKVMDSLRLISKNDLRFYISTTISQLNIMNVEGMVKLAISLGAQSIQFGKVERIGRGSKLDKIALSIMQLKYLDREIKRLKLEYKNLVEIGYKEDEWLSLTPGQRSAEVYCTAGTSRITIAPNGDVYPCVLCFGDPRYLVGTVRENSVQDLWVHGQWERARTKVPLSKLSVCSKCGVSSRCVIKNCRFGALYSKGDFLAVPPMCTYSDRNFAAGS
jgi:radical SAM protein with 4Fe4S-binding SPASM domain